jgi:hypothetical protein
MTSLLVFIKIIQPFSENLTRLSLPNRSCHTHTTRSIALQTSNRKTQLRLCLRKRYYYQLLKTSSCFHLQFMLATSVPGLRYSCDRNRLRRCGFRYSGVQWEGYRGLYIMVNAGFVRVAVDNHVLTRSRSRVWCYSHKHCQTTRLFPSRTVKQVLTLIKRHRNNLSRRTPINIPLYT